MPSQIRKHDARYLTALRKIEDGYVGDLLKAHKSGRGEIAEAASRYDVTDPKFRLAGQQVLNELGKTARAGGITAAEQIAEAIVDEIEDALDMAGQSLPEGVDIYDIALDIADDVLGIEPVWLATARAEFVANLSYLASGVAATAAVSRLIGGDGDKLSWWDRLENTIKLGTVRAVYTAINNAHTRVAQEINKQAVQTNAEEFTGGKWQKQAIIAADDKTTPCCLDIAAAIVGVDEDFHTPEPPAWAEYQQNPPFHVNCRTVTVLYHPSFEKFHPTTAEMKAAAETWKSSKERTSPRTHSFTRSRGGKR